MTEAEIIDGILVREAGYVDRPADRGGCTNRGVTRATLTRWRGREATCADVRTLTDEEARRIYAELYIKPWAWVSDERVRVFLVDWGVNSRMTTAITALQMAVGATPDGVAGAQTLRLTAAAIERDAAGLFLKLWRRRQDLYLSLALDEPRLRVLMRSGPPLQLENLRGWLHRLAEFIT